MENNTHMNFASIVCHRRAESHLFKHSWIVFLSEMNENYARELLMFTDLNNDLFSTVRSTRTDQRNRYIHVVHN